MQKAGMPVTCLAAHQLPCHDAYCTDSDTQKRPVTHRVDSHIKVIERVHIESAYMAGFPLQVPVNSCSRCTRQQVTTRLTHSRMPKKAAHLCSMPQPADPVSIFFNIFMSDHGTSVLALHTTLPDSSRLTFPVLTTQQGDNRQDVKFGRH